MGENMFNLEKKDIFCIILILIMISVTFATGFNNSKLSTENEDLKMTNEYLKIQNEMKCKCYEERSCVNGNN